MTWEEALKHLTAMKICTECQISGKSTFCDDCEWNYESGTLGDVVQALDIAIKSLDCRNCQKWETCPCGENGHRKGTSIGHSIGECKDYKEKHNDKNID